MYCPNCGANNEAGVRFCANCGTPLGSAPGPNPLPNPLPDPMMNQAPGPYSMQNPLAGGGNSLGKNIGIGCLVAVVLFFFVGLSCTRACFGLRHGSRYIMRRY